MTKLTEDVEITQRLRGRAWPVSLILEPICEQKKKKSGMQ